MTNENSLSNSATDGLPPSALTLRLLGPFEAHLTGQDSARFETDAARALLAYLAMNDATPKPRAQLAELLWESDENSNTGRTNLRSSLRRLRNALQTPAGDPEILLVQNDFLQMNPHAASWVDAKEFESLIGATDRHDHADIFDCPECRVHLERAIALYRGDFLADVAVESRPFEDWQRTQQERFQWMVVCALQTVTEQRFRIGDYTGAIGAAHQILDMEPWNEEAHRQLMRLYLASGQRSAALAQYELCRKSLFAEFRTVPSEETDDLYAQVAAGQQAGAVAGAENPYVGLAPFGVAEAPCYFGRETAVERLIEALKHGSLVALVGPSGSGKSSVLAAGLTATLLHDAVDLPIDASRTRIITLRPRNNPFLSLAAALAPYLHTSKSEIVLAAELRQGRPWLKTAIDDVLGTEIGVENRPDRLLLIVDQFEELYTLCRDPQTQAAFIDVLLPEADGQSVQIPQLSIVIAMRVDFLSTALQSRKLADAFQDHTVVLGPMNRSEMRRAIEEPARQRGVAFEPGLIERLLDDVGEEPGSLPLLQFALAQLWDAQINGWITHAAYVKINGVKGALAHYADNFYTSLPPTERDQAQQILLALVQPGDTNVDTRRFALRSEIGEAQWPLVQRMADARLVVTDRGPDGAEKVELAHEALIVEWSRLRDWLETDRVFRVWQQQMWLSARHWRESGNDTAALLRGGRLAEAERWHEERRHDVSPAVLTYIGASVEERERSDAQVAAQRAAVLNQMTALAESEHKRADVEAKAKRRLALLTTGLAAAALLLLGVTAFALQAQQTANEQRQRAEANSELALSRQLSAQAVDAADANVDLASLLSLEMLKRSNSTGDVNEMMARFDVNPLLTTILHNEQSPLYGLAFTADGQRLIGGTEHGDVVSWDLATRQPAIGLPNPSETGVGLGISPGGDRLVVAEGTEAKLYDAVTMQEIAPLGGHQAPIVRVSFTYDGSRIFTVDREFETRVWDAETGAFIKRLPPVGERDIIAPVSVDGTIIALGDHPGDQDGSDLWNTETQTQTGVSLLGHTAELNSLSVSPDGRLIATASNDGTARLWDAKTGEAFGEPLRGHVGRVLFSTFSPDGKILATGGTDNKVLLWNVETGTQFGSPLLGHGNWVRTGAFSPDGRMLATGDVDGKVLLWNIARGNPLRGHTQRARSVAISPDGNTIVTGGFDTDLIVWDVATLKARRVIDTEHEHSIIQVRFSPDGKTLASVDAGGGMILWDPETWQPRYPLSSQGESVLIGLAFSPDSRELAAGAFDGTIQFWDVQSGQPNGEPIHAHNDWTLALAYSHDGAELVSGSKDGTISRWDAKSHESIGGPVAAHTNWVTDLEFAPDGSAFVSSSADGTMRVWDAETGAPIGEPWVADGTQVWNVQFDKSYDPVQLVSLGGDGTVYWWDWAQRRLVRPPLRTGKETEDMALSPDGRLVVLGAIDNDAYAFRVNRTIWADQACRIANRWLSEDEWKTYMGDLPYLPSCTRPG